MEKITISKIKETARESNCKIWRSGYLNNQPAYKIITPNRTSLMTKENIIEKYVRGELF